ncbi:MAG TPA: ABC transporter ATP-binding protein, partial [Spirochaetia bacterium]|nr:ABC transporter ATP-binding protein [Spirochaetia bacterium]
MIGGAAHGGPAGMISSLGGGETGKISGRTLIRLLAFVRPYRKMLAGAGLLMLVASGASLLVPYLTKVVIDSDISTRNLHGLLQNGALLGAAMVVGFITSALESFLLSKIGQLVLNNLRNRLFDHLQRLSVAYNDGHIVGVTISRVINDVSVINNLLSQGLLSMIGDTITIAGTVVVMVAMDARLALLTFCVLPFMVLATLLFSRKARGAFLSTREKIGEVVGGLAENIGGVREIQAFSQEEHTQRRFDTSNRENRDANVRAMTLSFVFMPAVDLLSIAATGIVLLAGGLMVAHGSLTIGVMVAFMTYVTRFFMPIRDLSQFYTTLQSASAGGARVLELLDTLPAVVEAPDAFDLPHDNGRRGLRLAFDHVSFSYKPGVEVLHDVSFSVEPGSMVALVGPTGAGKTSISNLLCRFYE